MPAFAFQGLILKKDESLGQCLTGEACPAYFLLPKARLNSFHLELAHIIEQMGLFYLAAVGTQPRAVWIEGTSGFL